MRIQSKITHDKMYDFIDLVTNEVVLRLIYSEGYVSIGADYINVSGVFTEEPDDTVLKDVCKYITEQDIEYGVDWTASNLYAFFKNEVERLPNNRYYVSSACGGLQPVLAILAILAVYSDIQRTDIKFIKNKWEARGHDEVKEYAGIKLNKGKFVIGMFPDQYEFKNDIQSIADCQFNDIEIGNTYCFGSYQQDYENTGEKEPVEWIVLDKNKSSVLLLSKKGLEIQPFNSTNHHVTWETCALREWLNTTFIQQAFSEEEQALIQETTVKQTKNPKYKNDPGNPTVDKVFILSCNEVKKYFKTEDNICCQPSDYAIYQSTCTEGKTLIGNDTCSWWLRTPGYSLSTACYVALDGVISFFGPLGKKNLTCVRPALWVKMK